MAVISELIRSESDGTLSFGDYTLDQKSKLSGYEFQGDSYKVKTFKEITKLEKNESFIYESVPGTAVHHMKATGESVEFLVEGVEQAQVTLELEAETEYEVLIDDIHIGSMKTNLGGKLVLSVEFNAEPQKVVVKKR
ncbi:MAG: endosialidase [Clostridia bacterium]|nr:endosialidase [Lachnospiraceae bacterium]NCC01493.1 endosialidase [Clostridia bacterium]NCD03264.1 endosialidase [Clostridia bacterium]